MNLNIIVLIYGLFYDSSVGNGVWGLGGGVGDWVGDGFRGGGSKFIPSNLQRKSLYKNFIKEILWKFFSSKIFYQKKKSCEIFLLEKFPIFFSKIFSKHVLKTLVRGPKITRKK